MSRSLHAGSGEAGSGSQADMCVLRRERSPDKRSMPTANKNFKR
jgi:hypothetical protein